MISTSAPVTPTAMMPPGEMTPDPMTPPTPVVLPTPEFETLFTAGDRTMGGVGRVVGTDAMVDGEPAILLIISDATIGTLLDNPAMTEFLSQNSTIDYGAWESATPQNAFGGTATTTADISARGASNSDKSGTFYANVLISGTNTSGNTSVYIDDHAAVVMGFEVTGGNMEFTLVGEPLSRLPATTDVFSGTYSGFVAAARKIAASAFIPTRGTFEMVVGSNAQISSFRADLGTEGAEGTEGSIRAMNISIDNATGSFDSTMGGTVTFGAGQTGSAVIDPASASDPVSFLGQFHGENASGVTGAFYNMDSSILGGFAGSKEAAMQ